MKKKSKNKKNKIVTFTIIIVILFMIIFGVEMITVKYNSKEVIKSTMDDATDTSSYDTSSLTFNEISITNDKTNLSSMCLDGCNIKTKMYGYDYKYIIRKNNKTLEYVLDVVKENKTIIEDKSLGTNINSLSLLNYNNYLVLVNQITKDEYNYDYALFIDNRDIYDEFSSLSVNEMEFTESGVIYYYDVCGTNSNGNGRRVKAIRNPYVSVPSVISSEVVTFEWCK